jgi:hypothetical protein
MIVRLGGESIAHPVAARERLRVIVQDAEARPSWIEAEQA